MPQTSRKCFDISLLCLFEDVRNFRCCVLPLEENMHFAKGLLQQFHNVIILCKSPTVTGCHWLVSKTGRNVHTMKVTSELLPSYDACQERTMLSTLRAISCCSLGLSFVDFNWCVSPWPWNEGGFRSIAAAVNWRLNLFQRTAIPSNATSELALRL